MNRAKSGRVMMLRPRFVAPTPLNVLTPSKQYMESTLSPDTIYELTEMAWCLISSCSSFWKDAPHGPNTRGLYSGSYISMIIYRHTAVS